MISQLLKICCLRILSLFMMFYHLTITILINSDLIAMATAIRVTQPSSSDEESDAPPTESNAEDINKLRLNKMLPLCQEVLLDKFYDNKTNPFSRDPEELTNQLMEKKTEIDEMLRKKQLNQVQHDLLLPPNGENVDPSKWDVTLLIRLLLSFCGYNYPEKNWIPSATDTDNFANIVRRSPTQNARNQRGVKSSL